jgi:hypothetical protein
VENFLSHGHVTFESLTADSIKIAWKNYESFKHSDVYQNCYQTFAATLITSGK